MPRRRPSPLPLLLLLVPAFLLHAGCRHAGAAGRSEVGLPFIQDDWEGALARARAEDKPLFVDLWAPWCHTCISMKRYVFPDPALAPLADRFVWVELDADRPENAAALEALPPTAMPTFYVVSPEGPTVLGRFSGAASVRQLRELLTQGERAHHALRAGSEEPGSPEHLLAEGDRAAAAGDLRQAESAWAAALEAAPPEWPRRPDVLVSRISALYRLGEWDRCLQLAKSRMKDTLIGHTARAADFTSYGLACAERVTDEAAVQRFLQAAAAPDGAISSLLAVPDAPLSADDRSDALRILREVHLALGRNDAARELAERQRRLADEAARGAPDAFTAMLWNWPRAEVYAFLGRPEALIPELEASVAALPDQYDPPYRLAWILLQAGQPDRAAGMARRAAELAYGPRKAQVLRLLADIERVRGDRQAERAARAAVLETLRGLPEGQRRPEAEAQAEAALEALEAG